jgi:hypothetical protein
MENNNNIAKFIPQTEWDTYSEEQKEINATRHNKATHGDHFCRLCNRTISDKVLDKSWYVHMTVDCELVAVGTEVDEWTSQGWFPVGSDCAKKIPANFRTKFNK